MNPMSRLPFGMEPWEYLLYALFSAAVWRLVGYRWWLVPLLLSGLFLWPFLVRFLRWFSRFASKRARAAGINREPGALYCAVCGAKLAPGSGPGALPLQVCAACGGKWCGGPALLDWIAKKKPGLREWLAYPEKIEKEEHPCPQCLKPLTIGSFRGAGFSAFRCEPCAGFWLVRVDWVSLELF